MNTTDAEPLPQREDRLSGRRRSPESIDVEVRSEFERDVDRVSYCYYLRRLAEITQVTSGYGRTLRHNRLTHSMKVAQVGRRLAQYLLADPKNAAGIAAAGGLDRNVVTAAGLLHDFGHPPYGHIGEKQLNKWARSGHYPLVDGFEGNAQTLRIILHLTVHQRRSASSPTDGLDLTRAVVAACVKYPYSRSDSTNGKWGYYLPEEDTFHEFVVPLLPGPHEKTLEAAVMDWADDITYAVHDLQDFYTDGVIPLHHLRHADGRSSHPGEFNDFWGYATAKMKDTQADMNKTRRKFETYAHQFPESSFHHSREEEAQIGSLASEIITNASKATSVSKTGMLYIDPEMQSIIEALKLVTWYYVIDHPDLITSQIGQGARINELCGRLFKRVEYCWAAVDRETRRVLEKQDRWLRRRRLPAKLREFVELLLAANGGQGAYDTPEESYKRAVLDYVASMTEHEFETMCKNMCVGEEYSRSLTNNTHGEFDPEAL